MNKEELNYNDFEIDEVESIELVGEQDTIDITVEDTHMFYANDIYTHNSGISADIVGIESIQGSIKRAQVGHLIISAGKTLPQKEMGLATMAILKSRFGGDGIVFKDMTFKNDTMEFDTAENSIISQFGFENDREVKKEEQKKQRTIEALESFRREKNKLINNNPTV